MEYLLESERDIESWKKRIKDAKIKQNKIGEGLGWKCSRVSKVLNSGLDIRMSTYLTFEKYLRSLGI